MHQLFQNIPRKKRDRSDSFRDPVLSSIYEGLFSSFLDFALDQFV